MRLRVPAGCTAERSSTSYDDQTAQPAHVHCNQGWFLPASKRKIEKGVLHDPVSVSYDMRLAQDA